MQSDQLGATPARPVTGGVFHDPSPNGELAPPPRAPLPPVPAVPEGYVPLAVDPTAGPDAARGAGELADEPRAR